MLMPRQKKTEICPLGGVGVGGKLKFQIWHLLLDGPRRFGELQRLIPRASRQMLTIQLRELEQAGALRRKVYEQMPPKVEYSLTEMGRSIEPIVRQMYDWGEWYGEQIGQDIDWLVRLSGRWTFWIWYHLLDGPRRFSELQRLIPRASRQILAIQLRELEQPCPAIAQIIAIDRGDDRMGKPQSSDRLGDPGGFGRIERAGQAGLDITEGTGPRTRVAHDHERRVFLFPAFTDVRAARFLANRDEPMLADDFLRCSPLLGARRPYSDPRRLSRNRLIRPMRLFRVTHPCGAAMRNAGEIGNRNHVPFLQPSPGRAWAMLGVLLKIGNRLTDFTRAAPLRRALAGHGTKAAFGKLE